MSKFFDKFSERLPGYAALLAIGVFLAYLLGRYATHVYDLSGSFGVLDLFDALPSFTDALFAHPLHILIANTTVRKYMVFGLALPFFFLLLSSRGMKLNNEDTEGAHGDARLATMKEKGALIDKKNYANNTWFSEHCGMALVPHDKQTKGVLEGRNLNVITYGTSGLGKTYNLVMPDILQSTGEVLEYEHVGYKMALKNLITNRKRTSNGDGARAMRSAADEWEEALREANIIPSPATKKKKFSAPGFDMVNIDPKGDNLRATGWLHMRAGQKIKVLNLIDPHESDKYNPLANIKTHYVDIKSPDKIEVGIKITAPSSTEEGAATETGELSEPLSMFNAGGIKKEGPWALDADIDFETQYTSIGDTPPTTLSVDELDAKIKELEQDNPDSPALKTLRTQREVRWIETQLGTYQVAASATDMARIKEGTDQGNAKEYAKAETVTVEGSGLSKVNETIKAYSYRRTKAYITITFYNESANDIGAYIEITLDSALKLQDVIASPYGRVLTATTAQGEASSTGTVIWDMQSQGLECPALGPNIPIQLVLEVAIVPMATPDGIDLTKTVDCLVANLKGTDAQSNDSSDPFWEDTKRLCFMSLIAYLFERYSAEYHTIPEMMNLLDMALDESGDPSIKSPLAVLMETWEYAREYVPGEKTRGEGQRGYVVASSWVSAKNPPHSRQDSLALHCYHAFMSGADDTVRSVIISCQACLVNLLAPEIKDLLSGDELELNTLGDAGQKQVVYMIVPDINSPFEFISALMIFQAIDLCQEKAYKRYGGKLPRHVRFIMDEAPNVGKIPILVRALAVVRSRNISITLFAQSTAQFKDVYGENGAVTLEDNCSTVLFLGSQNEETLKKMSDKIGTETVHSRHFQRNFGELGVSSVGESISSSERNVRTTSQMAHMNKGTIYAFVFSHWAVEDRKFQTNKHPLFAYVYPGHESTLFMPKAKYQNSFDFMTYKKYRDAGQVRVA